MSSPATDLGAAPPPGPAPAADGAIAILGWGSLIWDIENLAPRVAGDWRMSAGPRLPIEFTRISQKRRGGLTLVIDARHGAEIPTHVIAHAGADLAAARTDLALRERAPERQIGWAARDSVWDPADPAAMAVRDWLRREGLDGAVWTALPGNFEAVSGKPFSHTAAEAHLQALAGGDLEEAVRYIHCAPAETDTPLRRHLAGCAWWRALVERHFP